MAEHAHHHDAHGVSDAALLWAVALNVLLTVVEVVAGIIAGSLALIGDAIHNGSDAGSLVIALVARRWSRRQPDDHRTYGYRRASVIGAMINVTTLMIIGGYLVIEAGMRVLDPQPVDGWVMVAVAAVALAVDAATVVLMRSMGGGLNIRAALAHNLADALASVAVIAAGACILLWGIAWVDPILTALIAAYVLVHAWGMMRASIRILMDSAPVGFNREVVMARLRAIRSIHDVQHLHVRCLDEQQTLVEVHALVDHAGAHELETIKRSIRNVLGEDFDVHHATIELAFRGGEAPASCQLSMSEERVDVQRQ